jgi:hypothetical protein
MAMAVCWLSARTYNRLGLDWKRYSGGSALTPFYAFYHYRKATGSEGQTGPFPCGLVLEEMASDEVVAKLIQSRHEGRKGCITCARRIWHLLVVRMSLLEPSRATPVFRCSCSMVSQVLGEARCGTGSAPAPLREGQAPPLRRRTLQRSRERQAPPLQQRTRRVVSRE